MADEKASMTKEEQQYFDSRGEAGPEKEEIDAEKPIEELKEELKTESTKPEKIKGTLKAKKAEKENEEQKTEESEARPAKDPKEEQIEKLNAALREQRSEERERERRTEARLQQLQDAVLKKSEPVQQPPEDAMPDPDKDAMGALKYLLKKQQEIGEFTTQTRQDQERAVAVKGIMGEAGRLEAEYLKQQPDYDSATGASPTYNEASAFLLTMRRSELQATGAYNPMQIQQIVTQEAIGLAAQALQNGKNPGEVVMNVAKARGFAPKPKQAAETEEEKIARIAKGQEQGFSLGQAAGSKAPNNSKLDAKTIVNMPDDQFTALLEKAKKSDLRALMGD